MLGIDGPFSLSYSKLAIDVLYQQEDFNISLVESDLGVQMVSSPPERTPGAQTVRCSSPKLANASSGSITQKAISRKIVLREDSGTGGLEGLHNYGSKKIVKKSKKM